MLNDLNLGLILVSFISIPEFIGFYIQTIIPFIWDVILIDGIWNSKIISWIWEEILVQGKFYICLIV